MFSMFTENSQDPRYWTYANGRNDASNTVGSTGKQPALYLVIYLNQIIIAFGQGSECAWLTNTHCSWRGEYETCRHEGERCRQTAVLHLIFKRAATWYNENNITVGIHNDMQIVKIGSIEWDKKIYKLCSGVQVSYFSMQL